MSHNTILAFAIGTAPHDTARQLIRLTYSMGDFEDWLEAVAIRTNHEARLRGLPHREDRPEPSGESDCDDFIDILTDDELQQQQSWIGVVSAFL